MPLLALQREFQDYVLSGRNAILERVEPGRLANHERRLSVYYDAYRSRLVEVLGNDFEALAAVLGQDSFGSACLHYVEATTSEFRNVRWYGGELGPFLSRTPPWSEQPWLADIARFEWTLTVAFDSADAPHVTFEDLAALPGDAWGALAFRLHPSVQLVELRANAPAIRMALDAAQPLPALEFSPEPVSWLVWRKGLSPHFRSLSTPEAWALRAARDAAAFPAICEGLCEWLEQDQAAAAAAAWLRSWVDDEVIADLTL